MALQFLMEPPLLWLALGFVSRFLSSTPPSRANLAAAWFGSHRSDPLAHSTDTSGRPAPINTSSSCTTSWAGTSSSGVNFTLMVCSF